MSGRGAVRELLSNYAKLKIEGAVDLQQHLSPVPDKVALIGRHGGDDFIGTLSAADVYHYQMLICDLVKLSLGVKDTEETNDRNLVARYAPLRQSSPDMVLAREIEPVAGPSTSSFQLTVRSAPSHMDTPLQFVTPPLPDFLEDTPLRVLPESRTATPRVMEHVRHSLQRTNDRELFDAPINDLFELALDDENLAEIERIFEANRRERIETRQVGRRTRIVGIRTELNALRPTTVTTAEPVADHDAYLYVEVMEYELIDTVQNEERNVIDIPENAMETFLSQLQTRRTTESLAFGIEDRYAAALPGNTTDSSLLLARRGTTESLPGVSPIEMPQPLTQSSDQGIDLERLPNLQEESIQPIPEPVDLNTLPPYEIPQMIERLVDTSPIVSPIHLRERNENRDGMYAELGVPPRRRRRRVNRVRDETPSPVPRQRRQRRSIRRSELGSPPEVMPNFTPEFEASQVIEQGLVQHEQSLLVSKFKRWQEAILSKMHETAWRYPNLIIELRRVKEIFPETRNLLAVLAKQKYTSCAEIIGNNRKNAAQRFTILLELNTRGLIVLKRNEHCVVLGVENPYLEPHVDGT